MIGRLRCCTSLRSSCFRMPYSYLNCKIYAWLIILLLIMVWCQRSLRHGTLRRHFFIFCMVMSIIFDDVPCLLHLSIRKRLLVHSRKRLLLHVHSLHIYAICAQQQMIYAFDHRPSPSGASLE